jgi:hypothetical protein
MATSGKVADFRIREEQRELQALKSKSEGKSRGTEIVPPPKLKFGPKASKAEVCRGGLYRGS